MRFPIILSILAASMFASDPNALVLSGVPTNGLLAQYDMVTITGGTTLVDQSGNGKNGTLNGATATTQGLLFNGTTNYVSLPALLNGGSAFTVFACAAGHGTALWAETNTGATSNLLRLSTDSTSAITDASGHGSTLVAPFTGAGLSASDYHCWYIQANKRESRFGAFNKFLSTDLDLGGTLSPSTNIGSIGARDTGSRDQFWGGTVAYLLVYNRILGHGELAGVYNYLLPILAVRGVQLGELFPPPGVWHRQGVLLNDVSDSPVVIKEGSTFYMWYFSGSNVYLRTSSDGVIWGAGTLCITSVGNASGMFRVVKVGSTYSLFANNAAGTAFDRYTSTDKTMWTKTNTSVLTVGSAGAWDDANLFNPFVRYDSGSWQMVYQAKGTGTSIYLCGNATSSDGVSWTKSVANPSTTYANPPCNSNSLAYSGGVYYQYGEDNAQAIYRRRSMSFAGLFSTNPARGVLLSQTPGETQQVASIWDLDLTDRVYRYYMAYDASGNATLRLLIANMPLSSVVASDEGTSTLFP